MDGAAEGPVQGDADIEHPLFLELPAHQIDRTEARLADVGRAAAFRDRGDQTDLGGVSDEGVDVGVDAERGRVGVAELAHLPQLVETVRRPPRHPFLDVDAGVEEMPCLAGCLDRHPRKGEVRKGRRRILKEPGLCAQGVLGGEQVSGRHPETQRHRVAPPSCEPAGCAELGSDRAAFRGSPPPRWVRSAPANEARPENTAEISGSAASGFGIRRAGTQARSDPRDNGPGRPWEFATGRALRQGPSRAD